MSYQVLARKYRPQRFDEVIGQEHVTRTLKNAIEQGRVAHGYIFSGHRGIGKTTVARILAMALNCRSADHPIAEPCGVCDSCAEIRSGSSVDVIEIDAATNRGIDEIRELREAARYRPARDRFKIYILDEAHQITDAAFNALLKTLEEPPDYVVFMMATTQPEDIPQTIRSRCQHFSFRAVRFDDIVGQLRAVADREQIQADNDALAILAEAGDGSMRDALSIMDQAIACCGDRLTAETVRGLVGAVPSEILEEVMRAVHANSSQDVLRRVDQLMTGGQNPTHFARQMVRFMRNAVVAKVAGQESPLLQISSDERARVGRVAELFTEEDLARFLQILLRTHGELGYKQEQRFHLELGLLKMVHAQRLLPLEELLSGAAAPAVERAPERAAASRSGRPEPTRAQSQASARPKGPSPFETDTARKSTPKPEMSAGPSGGASAAAATAPAMESVPASGDLRNDLLAALETARKRTLASLLEAGEWQLNGDELVIKTAAPAAVLELEYNPEAKRIVAAATVASAGRPLRVQVVSGAPVNGNVAARPMNHANGGGRDRVQQDPVVRRMQEKFGAEIRTVIDYRDKRS